ncbi:unnamed protein product [Enterobius vermicularis]|uniref:YhhN-like protein n=1 Tax=Enterobius vermicularis TaxID=51028 RepID=A0A0N4UY06_ENTVE|nr:unnamed protein product [Enterobius vermicularis]
MHFSNPVQILLLYSMLAFVSYIESHEFRDEAPFLHVLPVITLAALTLPLTMEKKPKLCTAASFLALAEGHYIQIVSRRGAEWSCVLIAISHLFYLASFVSYVRKIWYQICVPIIICYFSLIYHCFGDIYWSFPMLTVLNALQIAIICGSLIAAASLWRWNSATGASQADLVRFIGLLLCFGCSSLVIISRFGVRIDKFSFTTKTLSYIAQGLLFLANERAF